MHKKNLQNIALVLVVILLPLVSGLAKADHLPPQSVLRIGGAEYQSGIYHCAVRLAQVYLKESQATRAIEGHPHRFGVAMSSAGSIANLRDLASGRLEFGYANALLAERVFKNPTNHGLDQSVSRLRLVAAVQPSVIQILTLKNTGNNAINQLNNKRVSFGMPDAGNRQAVDALLSLHGVDTASLKAFHFPFELAIKKLVAGEMDAIVSIDQVHNSLATELLETGQYQLINFDQQIVQDFLSNREDAVYGLLTKSPFPQYKAPFVGVTLETYLLSQDTVSPAIVEPVLEYLLAESAKLNTKAIKAEPWQTIKLQGVSSAIPLHDACSLIEQKQSLSAKLPGTPDPANNTASIEHKEH